MPSKLMLFNFIAKHGDNAIDDLLEIISKPGARQRDASIYFKEADSVISKFITANILWHAVLHPELREVLEHYKANKDLRHIQIVKKEAQILRFR